MVLLVPVAHSRDTGENAAAANAGTGLHGTSGTDHATPVANSSETTGTYATPNVGAALRGRVNASAASLPVGRQGVLNGVSKANVSAPQSGDTHTVQGVCPTSPQACLVPCSGLWSNACWCPTLTGLIHCSGGTGGGGGGGGGPAPAPGPPAPAPGQPVTPGIPAPSPPGGCFDENDWKDENGYTCWWWDSCEADDCTAAGLSRHGCLELRSMCPHACGLC